MDSSLLQTFNKLTATQQQTTLKYLLQWVIAQTQKKSNVVRSAEADKTSDQSTDSIYQIMRDYLDSPVQHDPKLYLVFFEILGNIAHDHDTQQSESHIRKQQQLKSALDKIHQQELNEQDTDTLLQDIQLT